MSAGEPRHLARPPIREAVIEFRFAHVADPRVEDLVPTSERFLAEFPKREQLVEGTFNVKVSADGLEPLAPKSTARGYRYFSENRDRAVAMSAASLAYSRFAGYKDRHGFLPEAMAALADYLSCLPDSGRESRISRIGIRFINLIALPHDGDEPINLDAIFVGLPQPIISEPIERLGVDRQMRSPTTGEVSRVRLHGPVTDNDASAGPAFLLDIDVWRDLDMPLHDSESSNAVISGLLDLRSRLFFGSLHETALARFE